MPIPELAIIFRGESVSGHPCAWGGKTNPDNRREVFPNILVFSNLALPPPLAPPDFLLENLAPEALLGAAN